jgi:hypothetical protein
VIDINFYLGSERREDRERETTSEGKASGCKLFGGVVKRFNSIHLNTALSISPPTAGGLSRVEKSWPKGKERKRTCVTVFRSQNPPQSVCCGVQASVTRKTDAEAERAIAVGC